MDTIMKKWHRLGIIGIMAAALSLPACERALHLLQMDFKTNFDIL